MRKNIFLITAFLCIAAVADAQLNTLFEQENPAGFSDVTNVVYANIQGRHYAIYHVRGNGEKIRIIDFTNYYMGVPASSGATRQKPIWRNSKCLFHASWYGNT